MSGQNRTFGFVTFRHEVSVPYTLEFLKGAQLFGRQLKLQSRGGSAQTYVSPAASPSASPLPSSGPSQQPEFRVPFPQDRNQGLHRSASFPGTDVEKMLLVSQGWQQMQNQPMSNDIMYGMYGRQQTLPLAGQQNLLGQQIQGYQQMRMQNTGDLNNWIPQPDVMLQLMTHMQQQQTGGSLGRNTHANKDNDGRHFNTHRGHHYDRDGGPHRSAHHQGRNHSEVDKRHHTADRSRMSGREQKQRRDLPSQHNRYR